MTTSVVPDVADGRESCAIPCFVDCDEAGVQADAVVKSLQDFDYISSNEVSSSHSDSAGGIALDAAGMCCALPGRVASVALLQLSAALCTPNPCYFKAYLLFTDAYWPADHYPAYCKEWPVPTLQGCCSGIHESVAQSNLRKP